MGKTKGAVNYTQQEIKAIQFLYPKLNVKEVTNFVNCVFSGPNRTIPAIRRLVNRLNIKTSQKVRYSEKELNLIAKLYDKGFSSKEITQQVNEKIHKANIRSVHAIECAISNKGIAIF